MIILGILACRIFEDELIHLLKKKNDFDQIILFNNKESQISFESKLITFHVPYQTCMSYSEFNSILEKNKSSNKILFIKLVGLRLHTYPELLKKYIYDEIKEIQQQTSINNILLFYGLCGNVLGNVEKDFTTSSFQVFILKESNGDIVDDCIGAVLEGRQNYLKLLKSFNRVGTLIQIPMEAMVCDDFLLEDYLNQGVSEKKARKMIKSMYKLSHYEKILFLDTGLPYTNLDLAKQKSKEHATYYNLEYSEVKMGTQKLFLKNYCSIIEKLLPIK